MDMRSMQKSILSKLDGLERGISAMENIHARVMWMGIWA